MSSGVRLRLLYWGFLPAIAAAAAVLGYYAYLSAAQYAALGEHAILQSTVVLVDEKVDRIEEQIITADHAVFHLVDLDAPERLEETWPPLAERISPSVRALAVVDEAGAVDAFVARLEPDAARAFRRLLRARILADLAAPPGRLGELRHLHRTYEGRSYLLSAETHRYLGRRVTFVAYHDPAYFLQEIFPTLFANEDAQQHRYNVVDEENRRVYGPNLTRSGDYLVGRRFPTTLYGWRLQVAPKQAPLLEARRRSGWVTEVGLVALALVVILLGVSFLIYAAAQENRLNQLRTEFVANVSHELKTPLSVVRMFAEMLLTKRVRSPEKEREYLEIILRESERLSALIENVLDFSALERGKHEFQLEPGPLPALLRRAVETFRFRLEQEGLEVRLDLPERVSRARFDEQAMLLVVLNLLDNAVKHGGTEGPVEVSLGEGRRHLYVRVRDHGPGIPVEDQKRVFERFYRVRRDDRGTRGSGIGLALVRGIVEAHGGRAWAENAPDGGALVTVSLPIARPGWEPEEEGAVSPALG